jgi:hypothetical protein
VEEGEDQIPDIEDISPIESKQFLSNHIHA